jgi:hypothetical protein
MQHAVGTQEPVVVQRLYDRNSGLVQRLVESRREDGKEVVDVGDVERPVGEEAAQPGTGPRVSSRPQPRPKCAQAVRDLLAIVHREKAHVVARLREQLRLDLHHGVLTAAVVVSIVEDSDPHAAGG